jgi:hypothetical protein
MAAWVWILIAIAAVIVVAVIGMAVRQRRTVALRQRFGPEYERAVLAREGRRPAEAELRGRERQRAKLDIKPLSEGERMRFSDEWRDVQERFVDEPFDAVVEADELVYIVMQTRGYPMGDFEAQADLVSVDYPKVVENYRLAHGVCEHARQQQASTEELRYALLRYRSLFDELLQPDGSRPDATSARIDGQHGAQGMSQDGSAGELNAGEEGARAQEAAGSPESVGRNTGGDR